MRVPADVLKCVVFIGVERKDGESISYRFGGTGFFVSVPFSTDATYVHLYIVTARHIAERFGAQPLCLRVNLKDGTSGILRMRGHLPWFFYPSQKGLSDVAVLPFMFDRPLVETMDYAHVGYDLFVTDDILNEGTIGLGDEVFITGLFSRMEGKARNFPIVRMGNVAMMPSEPVPHVRMGTETGDMEAYLIEARSLGGLSGSPAFVRESTRLPLVSAKDNSPNELLGVGRYYLLGLMQSHWEIADSQRNTTEFIPRSGDEGSVNVGIAVVVPAKSIAEVLNQQALVNMRRAHEIAFAASQPVTTEATMGDSTKPQTLDDASGGA